METLSLHRKARRVTRFVTIQFIALAGWVAVQTFFAISPIGRELPFITILFIEGVWWIALLFIMLQLFLREYNRFVRAALDLEDANTRLRMRTNDMLENMRMSLASKAEADLKNTGTLGKENTRIEQPLEAIEQKSFGED